MAVAEKLVVLNAQAWADRINDRWRQSLEAIIETGRLLIEAKGSLKHGEFGEMCQRLLPFSQDTAQRLMVIARDKRLSEPGVALLLPPSWSTLHVITQLSDDEMKDAVKKKIIRPDVERWEIEGFRRGVDTLPKPANDDAWVARLGASDVRAWTIAQLKANTKILQAIIRQAGAASQLTTVGEAISDKNLKKIWGAK